MSTCKILVAVFFSVTVLLASCMMKNSSCCNVPAGPLMVQDCPGYNSWSFVQMLGKRLVCVYSRGSMHTTDEITRQCLARTSDDGGRTWGPEVIVTDSKDFCDCAVGKGVDENGDLLIWVRCNARTRHFELFRSSDGVAYEKIATLTPPVMPMQIMDVMHIPGVGLMCFWFGGHYQDKPENSWGTMISTDNGVTWTQNVVEQNLMKGEWPTEPCGVYLGGGRILAIARFEGGAAPVESQFQLQSEDYGRTWKKMRTNITDICISTPSLILDSKTGLISNYYYERGKGFLKRRVVSAEAIWNRPEAWPEAEVVGTGSANAHHAGNVNAGAYGGIHYCTYYTGDEHKTSVVVLPVSAPETADSVK